MINKSILQSVISKYYLNVCESVKWKVNSNNLSIDFMTPSANVIGKITCKNFPLEDSELAVYDTKKLSNLIYEIRSRPQNIFLKENYRYVIF